MHTNRGSYTLIELAAVLAVLLVVALVLAPVFLSWRETARNASCAGNLKQVAVATLMYVQDYDERPPAAWRGTAPQAGQAYTWRLMVLPYMRNEQVLFCPDHHLRRPWNPGLPQVGLPQPSRAEWAGQSSYAANTVHTAPGGPQPFFGSDVEYGLLDEAASTVMYAESTSERPWIEFATNQHGFDYSQHPGAKTHRLAHLAYVDGHVRANWPEDVECSDVYPRKGCQWMIRVKPQQQMGP